MNVPHGFSLQERLMNKGTAVPWQSGMDMRCWYPVSVDAGKDAIAMCWRDMGNTRFSDSFFENTLARQPREERRVCRTPLSALAQLEDSLAPAAFFFHISRCGSTLLTQMLATLPHCVVMSEPPIIDSLLRLHHDSSAIDSIALLRLAMLAMGQRRFGHEAHYVIKFDCWHIHSLDLIRQAFPGTPCFFLYREPQAVLASHQRQRGPQMVPGMLHPALLPLPEHALAPGDLDGYAGLVLASLYETAHRHAAAGKLALINYSQLPGIVFSELLERLGIKPTAEQLQTMRERSGRHAKYGTAFNGDLQAPAGCRLPAIAAQLQPGYLALEALRAAP
ncbi:MULTISPECIES: hypothetical protein [unclassified Janthinobacterium]|uniref:hypothetical protein n=1 Tax=unclassified Janthinobacterium TaxID=2610881 RepID=UPI001612C2D0|nr:MULTISPECIES: hypothetical protein [unclassified Janthinobacterium]MBB5367119.1 hypothetical protein [Janthinobacterium sp. K2C7]MBB5380403.1 hypothetical protein [Janthinobacterium sp. K2Li3]MBB5385501.1 hypothetical protein [Janthinobacterium sp. K2E3]